MNQDYLLDHWSYSSMKEFLANRYKFLHVYVLKTWRFQTSPSMLVGRAAHMAMERILAGAPLEVGLEAALAHIDGIPDDEVRWGKTGSRDACAKMVAYAVNAYLAEMPELGKITAIETPLVEMVEIDRDRCPAGEDFPAFGIPAKSVPDVVAEKDGELVIYDHKFVRSHSGGEEDKGGHILQALFNYHTVKARYGRAPTKMVFMEVKTTENKDGTAQLQPYTINYADHPEYFAMFYRLYDACSVEISKPDCLFLPNIADFQDGEETMKLFAGETVGIDRPKAVKHKTEDVALVDKKYVPSSVDRVENEFLPDEEKIRLKLLEFGVSVEMQDRQEGHSVTRYTLKPARRTKMKEFDQYARDLALALKAETIRVEAPIPGTGLVGIEVPAKKRKFVELDLKEVVPDGKIIFPAGINVAGEVIDVDLSEAPHLLVAGTTGSGKSVFLNTMIAALTARCAPEELKLILIDPKRVELSRFKNSAHILARPIYEVEEAVTTLKWLCSEMERRYELLESISVRNIREYNEQMEAMPYLVVVIDEFADLLLQDATGAAENAIVRLAQKARAVGIHLVIGTQRPSVDVVSGLIKANFPTRVAFRTASAVDSRVVLDQEGAELLLGKGDMLLMDPAKRGLTRLQAFSL